MNRNQLPGGRREQVIEYSYPGRVEGQETKAMKQRRKLFDELTEGIDAMQQRRKGTTHPALE